MTVTRKILLIANPGERFAENYCLGVFKDIENYKIFFKSPCGGLWLDSEITVLERPTTDTVRQEISKLSNFNYAKIIFTGHGYYSYNRDDTILELKTGEQIASNELKKGAPKQTIILDCCRKIERELTEELKKSMVMDNSLQFNSSECRKYYDMQIEKCDPFKIMVHSCSINEYSGDDPERGGYFSYSLLKAAKDWTNGRIRNLLRENHDTLSIVAAFNSSSETVINKSGNAQHPKIEKQRTEPYFPFAVVA